MLLMHQPTSPSAAQSTAANTTSCQQTFSSVPTTDSWTHGGTDGAQPNSPHSQSHPTAPPLRQNQPSFLFKNMPLSQPPAGPLPAHSSPVQLPPYMNMHSTAAGQTQLPRPALMSAPPALYDPMMLFHSPQHSVPVILPPAGAVVLSDAPSVQQQQPAEAQFMPGLSVAHSHQQRPQVRGTMQRREHAVACPPQHTCALRTQHSGVDSDALQGLSADQGVARGPQESPTRNANTESAGTRTKDHAAAWRLKRR